MPKTKAASPARSQGGPTTPKRKTNRGSRSLCSPALSTASGRLTSLVDQFKDKNMESFALSPLNGRSVLNDNTEIEEPRRKSWWKKLDENSQDVMEVLEDNKLTVNNQMEDLSEIEVLSQEKKNYTLGLPESSDNESIHSIVLPQRKLFTQKENQPQKKYGHLMDNRESLAKLQKTNNTNIDKTVNVGTRELFQNAKRSKPIFPAALLNISPNKTTADKTKENVLADPKPQVRNIFGSRPANKRKNMFADFIVSESEDEIPDIQPKVFGFQKKLEQRRISSVSRGREASPSSSITTDIEMDFGMLLPSSTMVENQLEDMVASTPVKRARLSKLSEAKESEAGTLQTNTTSNRTKQSIKSTSSKNKSKASPEMKNKSFNSSRTTRSMLKNASKLEESVNISITQDAKGNKSKSKISYKENELDSSSSKTDSSKQNTLNKSQNQSKIKKRNSPKAIETEIESEENVDNVDNVINNATRVINKSTNQSTLNKSQNQNKSKTRKSPNAKETEVESDNVVDIENVINNATRVINKSTNKSMLNKSQNQNKSKTRNSPNAKETEVESDNVDDIDNVINNATRVINKSTNKTLDNITATNKSVNEKEHTVTVKVHDKVDRTTNNDEQNEEEDDENNFSLQYENDDEVLDEADVNNHQKDNIRTHNTETINKSSLSNKSVQKLQKQAKTVEESVESQTEQYSADDNVHGSQEETANVQNQESEDEETVDQENEEVANNACKSLNEKMEQDSDNEVNVSQEDAEVNESEDNQDEVNVSQENEDEQNESEEVENEENQSEEMEEKESEIEEDEANESQEVANESQEEEDQANESQEVANESHEEEDQADESLEVANESQEEEDQADESLEVANESQKGEYQANESQEKADQANNDSHEAHENDNDESQSEKEVDEANENQEVANESQEEIDQANKSNEIEEEANESQEIDEETHESKIVDDEAPEQEDDVEMDEDEEDAVNESQINEVSANESQEVENDEEESHEVESDAEVNESEEVEDDQQMDVSDEADKAIASEPEISDDNQADEVQDDQESDNADETEQNEHVSHEDIQIEEQNEIEPSDEIEESPDVTHDTTGRHRKKHLDKSPEVILHDKTNQMDSFTAKGRNTSVRKTKSMIKNLNIRPSLAPPRDSIGFSDGTTNSSAEGSGWDSHRTTRKTLRQTFGKDFTPRKSLRALVMEKSAKRQTEHMEMQSETMKFPLANSTEMPEDSLPVEDIVESDHEASRITRLATLEQYLQKIKEQNIAKKLEMEAAIRNSFKAPLTNSLSLFKVPNKPAPRRPNPTQSKPKKQIKSVTAFGPLPPDVIEDMKYKPPKRFQPTNASWVTKRLYKYLETKLEPKYDYRARVRAEKLVETIYFFSKDIRRHNVAPPDAVDVLKHEFARLEIVRTHYEFYEFFHEFMPREVRVKVVPDIVNKIALPRHGVFSDILRGNIIVHE